MVGRLFRTIDGGEQFEAVRGLRGGNTPEPVPIGGRGGCGSVADKIALADCWPGVAGNIVQRERWPVWFVFQRWPWLWLWWPWC